MSEKAKFRYSAQDGTLELEGSEEFVSKHFESLTDIVRIISRHTPIDQKKESQETEPVSSNINDSQGIDQQSKEEGLDSYPSVFSEINGKLKIVSDIPGSSRKEKMINAALLYCYGSKLLGDEQVPSKEIREICEEHGCLDGPNFSKIFNDKTLFLSDGVKGGNKQIKLTFQGERKAKAMLIDDLYES